MNPIAHPRSARRGDRREGSAQVELTIAKLRVFDDDFGRSGAGSARPGFEKPLAASARKLAFSGCEHGVECVEGGDWYQEPY